MPDNPSPTAKQRSSRFVKSIGGIWAPHTKARLTKEITEAEQAREKQILDIALRYFSEHENFSRFIKEVCNAP
jgi:hypothetical protein